MALSCVRSRNANGFEAVAMVPAAAVSGSSKVLVFAVAPASALERLVATAVLATT